MTLIRSIRGSKGVARGGNAKARQSKSRQLTLRLATWNCCRGKLENKLVPVMSLQPDILAVQECANPFDAFPGGTAAWVGDRSSQGLLLLASNGYRLQSHKKTIGTSNSIKHFLAARVRGPVEFNVLAVWAKRCEGRPAYVTTLMRGLDAFKRFIGSAPTVLLGDLNTHPVFGPAHHNFVDRLRSEFGLVSSYHAFLGETEGDESRFTHFHYRHRHRPFHIDYCFIPEDWQQKIIDVMVGTHREWTHLSDHVPLVVDIDVRQLLVSNGAAVKGSVAARAGRSGP